MNKIQPLYLRSHSKRTKKRFARTLNFVKNVDIHVNTELNIFQLEEIKYFLNHESINVLNSIFRDRLYIEDIRLEFIPSLIDNNILYHYNYGFINNEIGKLNEMLKESESEYNILIQRAKIFKMYYDFIKNVYRYDIVYNSYQGIFEKLQDQNTVKKIVNHIVNDIDGRYYFYDESTFKIYVEYPDYFSIEDAKCVLCYEQPDNYSEVELKYDVQNNIIKLNDKFDNLTKQTFAQKNYSGFYIFYDNLFSSVMNAISNGMPQH